MPQLIRVIGTTLILLASSGASDVRIGVLGLFHPTELRVVSADRQKLTVRVDATEVRVHELRVRIAGERIDVASDALRVKAERIEILGDHWLIVPGRISRHFGGKMSVRARNHELLAIVSLPLEDAVARVVKAESGVEIPSEALRAQAIVTRSYLAAKGKRHVEFDFCDTTHCQLLGEGVAESDPAAIAARATAGIVITYEKAVLPAMFSKSCGGRSVSAAGVGLDGGANAYPYYEVTTTYCLRHPDRWRRSLPSRADVVRDAAWGTESFRLAIGRIFGWSALPSNRYQVRPQKYGFLVEGTGRGHGLGLCQRGAAAMAAEGAGSREILAHYYPNTKLESLPD
jgi:stage II sporulation protein D